MSNHGFEKRIMENKMEKVTGLTPYMVGEKIEKNIICTFKGKDIEEMTKEELLEALKWAFKENKELHEKSYNMQKSALSQGSFV